MSMTVLIIEDNAQNRYLVTYLLQKNGYYVVEAEDGPSGLIAAKNDNIDLVLLDIQLPIMDGYAIARALRADPATHHLPIIAVTSYAMGGDHSNILASGCNGY